MEANVPGPATLFGHPKGLSVLAGTELWERFSFYGMQALLMLYMTKYLLLPDHARGVLGLGAFRSALTASFGPMTDLAFAAQTYGLYSGLIYTTPLVGAWFGDRVLGKTSTVTIGTLLMTAGHLTMALEHLFLVALLLIIIGAGCVLGNMAAQVGLLYAPEDDRRTRAFGLYLLALNIGALAAPLVVGTLGEEVGWHWGFGAAGVGMMIGLATYLIGRKHLPPSTISRRKDGSRLTRAQWRVVFAIFVMLIPYVLANAALNQAYGIMYVWADTAVDRHVLGWEVPVTWVGTFDGLMTIVGVLIANRLWKWQVDRGFQMSDMTKMAIGWGGFALGFFYISLVALLPPAPLVLWLGFFVLIDLPTVWSEAPPQSVITRYAAPSITATMIALFKLANAFAYFLLGWLGRFYEPLGASAYWAMTALMPLAAMVMILSLKLPLTRALTSVEPSRG